MIDLYQRLQHPLMPQSRSCYVHIFYIFALLLVCIWSRQSWIPDASLRQLNPITNETYQRLHLSSLSTGKPMLVNECLQHIAWFVVTAPQFAARRAAVLDTWGRDLPNMFFGTSAGNDQPSPLFVPLVDHETGGNGPKVMKGWNYMWEKHKDNADIWWYVNVDDDSFVFLDSFVGYISLKDPQQPWMFGEIGDNAAGERWIRGGGSIVLSRAAMQLVGPKLTTCRADMPGDAAFSSCAAAAGVKLSSQPEFHYFSAFDKNEIERAHNLNMPPAVYHHMSPQEIRFLYWLRYSALRQASSLERLQRD